MRASNSPSTQPTATPTVSSIARTDRRPRATPSEITAETGAKNGLLWIVEAIAHAAPAATVVWPCCNSMELARPVRIPVRNIYAHTYKVNAPYNRPIFPLGKDIGYLPGDKDQKLTAWMQPIFDNMAYLLMVLLSTPAPSVSSLAA